MQLHDEGGRQHRRGREGEVEGAAGVDDPGDGGHHDRRQQAPIAIGQPSRTPIRREDDHHVEELLHRKHAQGPGSGRPPEDPADHGEQRRLRIGETHRRPQGHQATRMEGVRISDRPLKITRFVDVKGQAAAVCGDATTG